MVNSSLEGKVLRIAWERKKTPLNAGGLAHDLEESKDQIAKAIWSLSGKSFLMRDFAAERDDGSASLFNESAPERLFRLSEKGVKFCRSFLDGDDPLQK